MKRNIILLLLVIPLISSCANPPVEIDSYQPVNRSANEKIEPLNNLLSIKHDNADYAVTAFLTGAENVVVVYLKIENKTGSDLTAADYSVKLTDGRDRLPLQLISREVVIAYRAREEGHKIESGNPMVDLALSQLGNITRSMGSSQLAQFLRSIDWAIEHYFAFRPIYAHQTREGVLCYSANFIREYPLTLEVIINDLTIDFDFQLILK
ncbi:MAG: hypothetical protein KKC80_02880 [Candidatus Margulisbacteria bacterium]|nr:hypothetical protein [Candidatus Margulisiibacteriota bacterium]MBU1616809.1 hypothetical protein [Candidatus Margulisiibacteriota bacterium]